ncbi:MAG: hypothetical protein KGH58_03410 [Candidatus Micrarchaeota archaeon]|nr:hypothetical protein [Candidatus Micrarchaeota archaeon]
MDKFRLAAELYLRTVVSKEIAPAIETMLRKADSAIEAVGARKKTAALALLAADAIPAIMAIQGTYHNEMVTAITLSIVAPPAYAMEYYCVKGIMAGYHRLKAHLRKGKSPANDAIGSFFFRA